MSRSAILPLTRSPWPCLLRPPNLGPRSRFLSFRFSSTNPSRHSSSSTFSYRIAASYSSKEHPLNLSRNLYIHDISPPIVNSSAAKASPKQTKSGRLRSGHDAFFVSDVENTGTVALGVVDGVGGWTDSGIDPADFSHSLCEHMGRLAASYPTGIEDAAIPLRPVKLLDLGYNCVMRDRDVLAGSSTACIATASRGGMLEVANLGDSGYSHFSPFRLSHISEPQTHAFNTPFQLSKIPKRMQAQQRLFGGTDHYSEQPSDADLYQHSLAHGDVLLFATDGVWDNLSPEDTLRIVSSLMLKSNGWVMSEQGTVGVGAELGALVAPTAAAATNSEEPKDKMRIANSGLAATLAMAITREAKMASLDKKRSGPFEKEVKKHFPWENWSGGKPDDICSLVAIVIEDGI